MTAPQKTANRPINATRLILCEGADEQHLLAMLLKERGLSEPDVEIVNAGGRDNIENKWNDIRVQSGGSDIRYLAIVFDSEDDPQGAQQWASNFVEANRQADLQIDTCQLPAKDLPGSLETLIRQAIAPTSEGYGCATQWEACVDAGENSKFRTSARKDKSWLQVWLTHRTTSTASSVGFAIANDKSPGRALRKELDAALSPLRTILDTVLSFPKTV